MKTPQDPARRPSAISGSKKQLRPRRSSGTVAAKSHIFGLRRKNPAERIDSHNKLT
jgi:hypothetical protein